MIRYVDQLDLQGKRALIRVDFNVPLDGNRHITDDTRIRAALPTIQYGLDQNARVILMSHLGRPKGKIKAEFSLKPAAEHLSRILGKEVKFAPDCIGPEVEKMIGEMKPGEVMMLENLRFHPEEEKNDPEFARKLASLADVYVNDAFATAHRAHASNVAILSFVPRYGAGFLLKNEIESFRKTMGNPERPVVAIMGGAKVSGKLDALENIIKKVDTVIVGGGMAFTFLKAKGYEVGKSLLEQDLIETARNIMAAAQERSVGFLLPVDCVVAEKPDPATETSIVPVENIPADMMGLDIGPETRRIFSNALKGAKTIVWNGPMGVFESEPFSKGTEAMVRAVADSPAFSFVGGGDTDTAVHMWNAADKMSYISTAGGAFLEMLEGKKLPAIEALEKAA